jgi:hypothetical protein
MHAEESKQVRHRLLEGAVGSRTRRAGSAPIWPST